MSALAIGDFLQDFGKRAVRASDRGKDPAQLASLAAGRAEPPITQEILDTAIGKAEAALREALAAEHEAALAAERETHAAEVAALNASLGSQIGAELAEKLSAMEASVAALAATTTARILAVHLTADVKERMVKALADTIRGAVRDSETVRIRVSGPLSLYEPLVAAIGEWSRQIDYTETQSFDLTVAIDDSLFETRLADWSAALAEALA